MLTRWQAKKLTFITLKGLGLILLFGVIVASFFGYFLDTLEKKRWVMLILSMLGFVSFCLGVWSMFLRGLRDGK
jgi:F0F1-type ATP synthase assembly protein I